MSMMGEQLVEEWLNRRGYFTIRGPSPKRYTNVTDPPSLACKF
jgi:hypothetical protein